jgi:hypothetical protein
MSKEADNLVLIYTSELIEAQSNTTSQGVFKQV